MENLGNFIVVLNAVGALVILFCATPTIIKNMRDDFRAYKLSCECKDRSWGGWF